MITQRLRTIVAFRAWIALASVISLVLGHFLAPVAGASPEQLGGCTALMQRGSKGACIGYLQEALNLYGYGLAVDRDFGQKTHNAVVAFQKSRGLAQDGIVGPQTRAALLASVPTPKPAAPAATCIATGPILPEWYLWGRACTPAGFPYQPIVRDTKAGVRALDPFNDSCSGFGVRDTGVTFDRHNACATHDYGYDLIRWGTPGVTKALVDWNFYLDMMADCQGRVWTNRQICENSANSYYIGVVKFGHPEKGQTISTTPNSNTR